MTAPARLASIVAARAFAEWEAQAIDEAEADAIRAEYVDPLANVSAAEAERIREAGRPRRRPDPAALRRVEAVAAAVEVEALAERIAEHVAGAIIRRLEARR